MKYGRVDAGGPNDCPQEGNLPDAEAGPDGNYGGDGGTVSTKDKTPEGESSILIREFAVCFGAKHSNN